MDPPLEARYKKRARRGNERRMVEYQVTLVAERPATTSHIRNNSPDYFPTGLQFANLLEKLVKYRRTAALYVCVCVYVCACALHHPPSPRHIAVYESFRIHLSLRPASPSPPRFVSAAIRAYRRDTRWPLCAIAAQWIDDPIKTWFAPAPGSTSFFVDDGMEEM